jgi:hypothetical protein
MKKLNLLLVILLLSNNTFGETKEELNSKTEFNNSLTAVIHPPSRPKLSQMAYI